MNLPAIAKEIVFDSEAAYKDHNQSANQNHHRANLDTWEAIMAIWDFEPCKALDAAAMATINRTQGHAHRAAAAWDHFLGKR